MKKPWVFAIGLGAGALIGFTGHAIWTLADDIHEGLIEAGNAAASVTYMEITIKELEAESDLLRQLAMIGLEGDSKVEIMSKLDTQNDLSLPNGFAKDEVFIKRDDNANTTLIFENDQLVWITNHCERNAVTSATCRPTGAN